MTIREFDWIEMLWRDAIARDMESLAYAYAQWGIRAGNDILAECAPESKSES